VIIVAEKQAKLKERRKLFFKLHASLAKKYGTAENHLSFKKIGFIRQQVIGLKLSKAQVIRKAENMMYRPHDKRRHKISWYLHLNNFLKNCDNKVWADITQHTEYDKW